MGLKLFTKLGCGPCVPIKRIAERVEGCEIISLDEHPECIEQYKLMSTPTLVVETDDDTDVIVTPALIMERLRKEII